MKLLGIDFGTKNIGIALSDESAGFAFPHSVLKNGKKIFKNISEICEENSVSKIILGRPEGYKGDASEILEQIEEFKTKLEKEIKLPIVFESEILTTKQAERIQGKHEKIDASAAALILQTYLDKRTES